MPLGADAIDAAIELNGVAVNANKRAFALGRLAAVDRKAVEEAAAPALHKRVEAPRTLDELIARRTEFLTAYQNAAYAQRYASFVAKVRAAEQAKLPGAEKLATAVANYLFKLMAYKDEYEVARLYTDGEFKDALNRQFDGKITLNSIWHRRCFQASTRRPGRPKKNPQIQGGWMMHGFKALAAMKQPARHGVRHFRLYQPSARWSAA